MKKLLCAVALLLVGCTDKERARHYGGTTTENLPAGQVLVNITWKEQSLWILTKQAPANHKPETYTFQEYSSNGIWEGTVILKETPGTASNEQ